jgi:hypothetical protein
MAQEQCENSNFLMLEILLPCSVEASYRPNGLGPSPEVRPSLGPKGAQARPRPTYTACSIMYEQSNVTLERWHTC